MSRMLATIKPKADQLNSDDMIGATSDLIIKVTAVEFHDDIQQPVSIHFDGCNGRPWKPCLSMRRILVQVWGGEENYPGRHISLFRDSRVSFGDQREIGGIRIRAMSDIDGEKVIALTATRGKKIKYTVRKLILQTAAPTKPVADAPPAPAPKYTAETAIARATEKARSGTDAFRVWYNSDDGKDCRETRALTPEVMLTLRDIASKADAAKDADPFGLPPIVDAPLDTRPTTATDAELSDAAAREQAAVDLLDRIDRGEA